MPNFMCLQLLLCSAVFGAGHSHSANLILWDGMFCAFTGWIVVNLSILPLAVFDRPFLWRQNSIIKGGEMQPHSPPFFEADTGGRLSDKPE